METPNPAIPPSPSEVLIDFESPCGTVVDTTDVVGGASSSGSVFTVPTEVEVDVDGFNTFPFSGFFTSVSVFCGLVTTGVVTSDDTGAG
jgi:hypothetical protein